MLSFMNNVIFGDCRDTMRGLIADGVKVQMCVTSPPYFGLRDYGHPGQLGLEQTPEEYVSAMVEVFALVRDLLADDGTLWINIGDSYARAGGWSNNNGLDGVATRQESLRAITNISVVGGASQKLAAGLKQKDLIGIPWRVAFALRADGWYLRQDIIWHKPNPMPESVKDRCTKAHEYLFLLSKSQRYYFDIAAISEAANPMNYRKNSSLRTVVPGQTRQGKLDSKRGEVACEMRNRRSVWTIPTKSYSGAHFATFPPALIEPCILAGSRPGDVVLDPFMGSGTVAQVSQQLGRNWIGCELNPEYLILQQQRTAQQVLPMFMEG